MQGSRLTLTNTTHSTSTHHTKHHGQSEEKTSSENVEAQTPQAAEGKPPQKAHMAEIIFPGFDPVSTSPAPFFRSGFFIFWFRARNGLTGLGGVVRFTALSHGGHSSVG